MDNLANTLSNIMNSEIIGKRFVLAKPSSKLIMSVLDIMKRNSYIDSYEKIENNKGGVIKITLGGKINKCGVINPRFSVKNSEFKKFEKRYLPAKNFGFLIVSTPKGIMTHIEAQELGMGGKLISYCY